MVTAAQAPEGWVVPFKNELTWSKDGRDLYFGFRPGDDEAEGGKAEGGNGLYDLDAIRLLNTHWKP